MTWIGFQNPEFGVSFAPTRERATVGAAESSNLRLLSKNMPPVHGQFTVEFGRLTYRDFLDRQSKVLSRDSEIQILNWRAFCLEEPEIWQRFGNEILKSFKDILKESDAQNIDIILQRLREKFFFSSTMPQEIECRLRRELGDISLDSPVEDLLSQSAVTDILISDYDEIWVEEDGELRKSDLRFATADSYRVYIENLLAKVERTLDDERPFIDFILPDGSRGHLIGQPITHRTFQLSIRKPRRDFMKLDDLFRAEMFSPRVLESIWQALSQRSNILVSGATGSGKTTLIRALLSEIPQAQRVLVIEDTPEINLRRQNTVYLCSRIDSMNAARTIDLRQLVKQSLRMRPDRIVVGEVRGEEAMDLLHAMNTGHRGCLGSLHANSARDALERLQGLVQMSSARLSEGAVRDLIARNIQLVIHCGRTETNKRVIQQLGYIRGLDQDRILLEVRE